MSEQRVGRHNYVLVERTSRSKGRLYLKQMTNIGPMTTPHFGEAMRFSTRLEAATHPATRFALTSFWVLAVKPPTIKKPRTGTPPGPPEPPRPTWVGKEQG